MPKTKISDYSSTASNNTDVDGINIAEGMAPSNVNNAMREIMAQLKDWQSGAVSQDMYVNGAFTASGNAVLSADLSVGDDLTVTGDATVGGGFTCTGAAVLSSNLTVGGAATITGNLAANGTSSLGATTFSGAVIMSSNVTVDGNATLNGNITAGSNTSDTVTLNALLSAGGGTGTSGQYLKSRGTSDTPTWDDVAQYVKAWVNFDGAGTVAIRAAFNVSSVTDNGIGDYTVNFATPMVDANYSVAGTTTGRNDGNSHGLVIRSSNNVDPTTKNATSLRVANRATSNNVATDVSDISVAIFR